MRVIEAKTKHTAQPARVGITNAAAVHFQLPVSFFTVRSEVEQGQCISENKIVHTAVTQVQPFAVNSSPICATESSVSVPCVI